MRCRWCFYDVYIFFYNFLKNNQREMTKKTPSKNIPSEMTYFTPKIEKKKMKFQIFSKVVKNDLEVIKT